MPNLYLLLFFPVVVFIIAFSLRGKRNPEIIQQICITFGILGTFVGIIWGLSNLDFTNLDVSIPELLNGIYVSFTSSLAGVIISFWIYMAPTFWKIEKKFEDNEETDTESQMLQELKMLNKNIIGDNENSLSTQLLKTKDALVEEQKELKKSFDEFAEKMADNNMKALEEVIKDFNTKLQEQFGENFKQLNEAVGALLEWQENYKLTIEKTTKELEDILENLQTSKETMATSADMVEKVANNISVFKESADELKEQLDKNKDAIESIKNFSTELDGKSDEIKKNMTEITKNSLQELGSNLKTISETLAKDYQEVQKAINQIKNNNTQ